ncbi:maltose alpha-D-glucosyltransferase [Tessaracoccus oleiagri]|uniref:Maltose alpha-D-glucosyltransferase/ alpha-amylase n=1 Tax=Tessaracoccus oleiagri TaxID=686624 RepID=A0A1G9ICE8_9ACTN|nr:maltose alpha-D-glucosyltransferase [Tessaracoccus oleiagri]SDL22877.1 maltose alpha-D-glucosyltransferase/ alpha-amylase [Tessaracoccus oleiagri]
MTSKNSGPVPQETFADAPEVVEELPEISFDEQRFAARPTRLRPRARRRSIDDSPITPPFEPTGSNRAYVEWLEEQSMLHDAERVARQLAGKHTMWSNPYAHPDPRAALARASVWYTAYPLSHITKPGQSFLNSLGSQELWEAFKQVGIDAVHTGPVKLAGGLKGWEPTPSVDGHFDRISMAIDPLFGTEDEFRDMCETATRMGGTVIDDIVPGHTGKGADFRLAELNYRDYPGIYHMVDIPEEAWHLLPDVPEGRDSVNLGVEAEQALAAEGYIIGELQRVIFYEPGVKETNWSVTPPIRDYKGRVRRWVYLHYFKEGQPTINWLDPTCAGMRLVMGDALHSLLDLGSGGLRLDANGFLGVERSFEAPAWSEGHPLSLAANQLIGSLVRKVGGFTFQELNLAIDDIQKTGAVGPDLSYDFITRPAAQVALATADTEFLRLVLREAMEIGVDQASLIHAMQNHDELTYELVHFAAAHRDDVYELGGEQYTGQTLAEHIRQTMRDRLTGEAAPYNAVFTTNGIASTTASIVAASLGIDNLDDITDAVARRIQQAHLLLCKFNAWQPGVFALSGWDLVGALPLPRQEVQALISSGDTRWIERGAYDILGVAPDAKKSSSGMPRARALYGPLPEQLKRETSFASRLSEVLKVRKRGGIDAATLVDVPDVNQKSLLVLVNELASGTTQITALNFGPEKIEARVQSALLPAGRAFDLNTRRKVANIDEMSGFNLELPAFGGQAMVIRD